jgi:hypothetical protein
VEPDRTPQRRKGVKRNAVLLAVAVVALLALGALALAGSQAAAPADPQRRTVPAPIDGLEVVIRESAPPQVSLKVNAGLPSGCARQHSHQVSRSGEVITVTVLNSMPSGDPICTMIYGNYELTIDLGSDFEPGRTYTVRVNDQTTTFKT